MQHTTYHQIEKLAHQLIKERKLESIRFTEVLKEIIKRQLFSTNILSRKSATYLSLDKIIANLPIDIDSILSSKKISRENLDSTIIPLDNDVFVMKHLNEINQRFHPHNCFDLYYIKNGNPTLYFEKSTFSLEAERIYLFSPYSRYKIIANQPDDEIYIFYIRNSSFDTLFFRLFDEYGELSSFIKNVIYNPTIPNYLCFDNLAWSDIENFIRNLFIECYFPDRYSNDVIIHFMHLLFVTIIRNCNFESIYNDVESSHNVYFFKILKYIYENFQTVSLRQLARHFGYSEAYLSTLFQKYLNTNYSKLITKIRLEKAIELFSSDLSLDNIAELVGYNSTDHFSRTFKKYYHCAPSVYRKRLLKK